MVNPWKLLVISVFSSTGPPALVEHFSVQYLIVFGAKSEHLGFNCVYVSEAHVRIVSVWLIGSRGRRSVLL